VPRIAVPLYFAQVWQNFVVAEEQKRTQQIEAYIRKAEPLSAHVSWIDRLNPYRLVTPRHPRHRAVDFDGLPPNPLLPLKQNTGPDVGGPSAKVS
jgi:hypothetical protein